MEPIQILCKNWLWTIMTRRTAFIRNDWKKGNSAERLSIDYLLIIWTCHFAETDVDGLFCYIQQAYFDDKKIRLLNRKSLSDTVKPCTIIWSNGINCHFFSKTLDNLDSVEVAVVEPVPLRGVTFLIQRQPLLPKVGIYSIDIGRFDGWKDFCGCMSL